MICIESSLFAIFGADAIADAAQRATPMRQAKDENVASGVNSRQSKSSRVFGLGMFWISISYANVRRFHKQ
jgi:hypothetical protein